MNEKVKGNLVRVNFFLAGFIAGVVTAVIMVISSGASQAPSIPPPKAGSHHADGLPCSEFRIQNSEFRIKNKDFSSPSSAAGRHLTGGLQFKQSAAVSLRLATAADNDTHIFTSLLRRGSSPIAALPNLKTQGPPEARQGQGLRKQGRLRLHAVSRPCPFKVLIID
jgi:uncharacterized membrane protein